MIKNKYGRWMNHDELYPLLGLKPSNPLPDEGFEDRCVWDERGNRHVLFSCSPVDQAKKGKRGGKPQRIKYLCWGCNYWVPFGRAGQHICGSKRYGNWRKPLYKVSKACKTMKEVV
jgi:hypothetical protein